MVRISVDVERCSGHGRCYVISPAVYSADDEGYCAQRGSEWELSDDLEPAARAGAAACPEAAIEVRKVEAV